MRSPKSAAQAIPPLTTRPLRAGTTGASPGRAASPTSASLCRLEPGAWSSQRHWHSKEDEFALLISGEAVLVTNAGETVMRPGDCASFPKNDGDAHHFVNRSNADAVLLVVGSNFADDTCTYPDIDMHLPRSDGPFTRKDGSAF